MSDESATGAESTTTPTAATVDDVAEWVLRKHQPVKVGDDVVICICSMMRTYEGPVGQRLHVVEQLREAGLLRGTTSTGASGE